MDTLRQDPCSVFRSILLQLGVLYNTISTPTLSQLQAAIVECGGRFERMWILLDGLDECADVHRADILSTLWVLIEHGVHVFVTSTPGVVDLRRDKSSEILDLEELVEGSREERMNDMKGLVKKKMGVAQWRRAVEGGAKEVEEVMGRVVERAGGV